MIFNGPPNLVPELTKIGGATAKCYWFRGSVWELHLFDI